MTPIFIVILLGSLVNTSYRSVPEQTDASPNFTATGEKTCGHGIAISQDLLKKNGGPLEFGDTVYIDQIGLKIVNDVMNRRHKQRIDVWVATYKEEKEFDLKFRNKKLKVWKIVTIFDKEPHKNEVRKMRISNAKDQVWNIFLQ